MISVNKKNYSPAEWDIGALLNNDQVFALARHKLHPETMLDHQLKKLVEVMVIHGNCIENIKQIDSELAIYAMELANNTAAWTIQLKEEGYESLKEN